MLWKNAYDKWKVSYKIVGTILNFIRKKDGKINIKTVVTSGKLAFEGYGFSLLWLLFLIYIFNLQRLGTIFIINYFLSSTIFIIIIFKNLKINLY